MTCFDRIAPHCTVIIPAYNEAQVIKNTLKRLLASNHLRPYMQIIVACNGCEDDTVAIARKTAPDALVLDLVTPSKTAALNAALVHAKSDHIVFLDADIETSGAAVMRLVSALQTSGKSLAYGRADYDLTGCSSAVRSFYSVWKQSSYFDKKKVGGFFAVSKDGLNLIAPFPKLTNDDEWVRRRLIHDSVYVGDAGYRVRLPQTLNALIGVRARVYRGNAQLDMQGLATAQTEAAKFKLARRVMIRPHLWPAFAIFVYVAIKAMRLKARQKQSWNQDKSARQAVANEAVAVRPLP